MIGKNQRDKAFPVMGEHNEIASILFHKAALKSERLRILALLTATGTMLLVSISRVVISQDSTLLPTLLAVIGVVTGFACYEIFMLRLVSRGIAHGKPPAGRIWITNTAIETCVPTLILLILSRSDIFMGDYRALSGPTTLVYVIFILFSILHLRAALCMITGLLSSGGYLLVLAYTWWSCPEPTASAYPTGVYLTFAAFIGIAGVAAAFVSTQIRKHVLAALREAETRRKIERIERDLDIARDIQQGMLPKTSPNIKGFDIAGWSLPADQTGGDYYDWQELPGDRLVVSLADVAGHGIGPALVTAVCRAYARASFPTGLDLGPAMSHINGLLVEDLEQGRFVTFVVAMVNAGAPQVQLLSAGHGPILVYSREDDRVEALNADDVPFGVLAGVDYGPERFITQGPGDILALVTDGFFEWHNAAGEQFGIERLKAALCAAKSLSATDVIQALYASVQQFVGDSGQEDDLTAIIIKREPV